MSQDDFIARLSVKSQEHIFLNELENDVDSGSNLPPILEKSCHPFWTKPASHSGGKFTTF